MLINMTERHLITKMKKNVNETTKLAKITEFGYDLTTWKQDPRAYKMPLDLMWNVN